MGVGLEVLRIGGAKGGDLNSFWPKEHMDEPKSPPDNPRPTKGTLHLFGGGIGRHIEIFRPQAEH
jgi:hypothetical protein